MWPGRGKGAGPQGRGRPSPSPSPFAFAIPNPFPVSFSPGPALRRRGPPRGLVDSAPEGEAVTSAESAILSAVGGGSARPGSPRSGVARPLVRLAGRVPPPRSGPRAAMANNSPAVGAGNCQGQQAAQHQPGAVPPAQQQLQSGAPKPAASGKQGNVLPLWGNEKTMNLNPMILTNILSSPYFKVQLYELKTYHEVVDEIYFKVSLRAAPWAPPTPRGSAGACPEAPGGWGF